MVGDVTARSGVTDILVNNAGIVLAYEPNHETDVAQCAKMLAVNQTGTFFGMRCHPSHVEGEEGLYRQSLVDLGQCRRPQRRILSGGQGRRPQHGQERCSDHGRHNIRLNSVHPGIIRAPLIATQSDAMNDTIVAVKPLKESDGPEDVASGCLYLASDGAAFVKVPGWPSMAALSCSDVARSRDFRVQSLGRLIHDCRSGGTGVQPEHQLDLLGQDAVE